MNFETFQNVVLVGGSAEDFEIPEMLMQHLPSIVSYVAVEISVEQRDREMQLLLVCFCPT